MIEMRSSAVRAWILGGIFVLTCHIAAPAGAERGAAAFAAAPAGPRAVAAWAAGPMEVRVAFNSPIDPAAARAMVDRFIPFGELSDRPGPRLVAALGRLRIAAARLDDGGRTLVLTTDPHPRQATYIVTVPVDDTTQGSVPQGGIPLAYDLRGVEVSWTAGRDGAGPASLSWWPQVDPTPVRTLAGGSVEHELSLEQLTKPGRLTLRTLLSLPKGNFTVGLQSEGSVEATLAFDSPKASAGDRGPHGAEWELESTGEPVELAATIPTGVNGKPVTFRAWYRTAGDPAARPIPASRQMLPWGPSTVATPTSALPIPFSLAGGNPLRGEAVFNSAEAKCSSCHKIRGKGGETGPSLDELADRDPASVYRDIAEPSAVIDPDYAPYAVALKDGRVAAGVVRAEGATAIRVHDVNGQSTVIPRSQIDELRPSTTSVMPAGLAGALGEARMRDLLAFLIASTAVPAGPVSPVSGAAPAAISASNAQGSEPKASPTPALPRLAAEVAFPKLQFERPVAMAYPDDSSNLLYVVEQRGRIWSFENAPGTAAKAEFLDIGAKVYSPASGGHNEEGLLGLAFHPDYGNNGEFFLYYSAHEGPTGRRSIVARYKVSRDDRHRADPASEQRIWVGPPDPYGNHNGGTIAFGPDGYLYITLGDSGAADDPLTTGQDPSDWFGSILRIDVDHPGDGKAYGIPRDNPRLRDPRRFAAWAPEVYCIGLRNVWKFSFDRMTHALWAGEVGQNLWEMVHVIENGGNYGWSIKEGFHSFRPRQRKDPASPLSPPLAEYPHAPNQAGSDRADDGKSITGGYVYRGRALPELAGIYVYADYDTGRIWGLRTQDGKALANGELVDRTRESHLNVASFGEDSKGELYIVAFDGRIYRLVARK
jgi:putative heme-binding domain-containing protein